MATQTQFVTQGTDFSTEMVLSFEDGSPINVASFVFAGALRQNPYSNYATANLNIAAVDAPNGNCVITLSAASTANIPVGTYIYTVVANTGNVTTQLLSGQFIVGPSALIAQPLPPNTSPQILDDYFEALSGQNTFYLSYAVANTSNVQIVYNNVPQANSNTIYTLTGQILIFANNATQGDIIQAKENVPVVVL